MCGIVGYVGPRDAVEVILDGLHRLEYRGYDSAGVAVVGPNGLAVRESIQLIQKTFLLRTCEESVFANRSRPCLMHQIKRCKGPCVGLVSKQDYAADVRLAEMFLRGRHAEVIDGLTARMETAAGGLRFEEAAALRDQIRALQAVLHRQ